MAGCYLLPSLLGLQDQSDDPALENGFIPTKRQLLPWQNLCIPIVRQAHYKSNEFILDNVGHFLLFALSELKFVLVHFVVFDEHQVEEEDPPAVAAISQDEVIGCGGGVSEREGATPLIRGIS